MSNKVCKNCGEVMASDCKKCPRCYAPAMDEPAPMHSETKRDWSFPTILAIILAFFGILGIGHILTMPHRKRGYIFLILGIVLFWSFIGAISIMRNSGWFTSLVLAIPTGILGLIYISAAIASILDLRHGSIFRFIKL